MINEFVKKAKKGDKKAFEKLIVYYQNDLYKIAKTRLKENDDIDDAIQETIISAYKSIKYLFNDSKFKSWLITILINKCNYIYKQKEKIKTISYDYLDGEKYISPKIEFESNIEFNNLMDLLNNDEKTILVLYYCEGYKSKEIAKILKMKDSTVRNKILRAKKKLKNDLEEVYKYG